ncbi:GNAT family N-acetyltransferase [Solidesulfovibrio sp.]|jgi:ribosomal protein S18 acetylase RimI-like enzyme|uniref:GNAT family N-acetyltransferase n=1 Tax=Solidesulfovibrio sp. TaxID=2910990 RepID=UPI000EE43A1D|nr:GNAT family N-acetyltransferase [Solidesulfovibrio sp.]MEA5089140.1 GNAT family N-acetyltransferase [Solidesulfovibrio sp.]HCR14400.1 GNAT family N-acetyltransferase [Desulfovibrio sp.]HML59941.1 GNAT family N-acetyltransferase [Solidesulfovibrio sp.]
MEYEIRFDCEGVDWTLVAATLKNVGMAYFEPDAHRRAFVASHTVVFVRDGDRLIGFGRAISDGVYQAAIYDVAVVPEFQGKGLGRAIMTNILSRLSHCNIILYASVGKEGFYRSLGMRSMKTGMALFKNVEAMAAKGFTD